MSQATHFNDSFFTPVHKCREYPANEPTRDKMNVSIIRCGGSHPQFFILHFSFVKVPTFIHLQIRSHSGGKPPQGPPQR